MSNAVNSDSGVRRSRPWANAFALLVVLVTIWLLWSGHYKPFLISCGIGSALLVVGLSRRMGIVDAEGAPLLGIRPLLYAPWLIGQIIHANIDVARRIINPGLPIHPHVIHVHSDQKTDLGRVVFANSVTLTPGTVSVDVRGDQLTVHALSKESAAFDETGEMNRRVSALEGPS